MKLTQTHAQMMHLVEVCDVCVSIPMITWKQIALLSQRGRTMLRVCQ